MSDKPLIRVQHLKAWNIHNGHRPDEWHVAHAAFRQKVMPFTSETYEGAVKRVAWIRTVLGDIDVEWVHSTGAHPDCKCHEGGKVIVGGVPEEIERIDREAVKTRAMLKERGML